MADRFKFVKDRAFRGLSASASPIFYRSHLFAPISHESPSILFDFIDQTASCPKPHDTFRQRRLHFTLYHLTYRYDVDSKWIDRLTCMIGGTTKEDTSDAVARELLSSESNRQSSDNSSLTRVSSRALPCYNVFHGRSLLTRLSFPIDFYYSCRLQPGLHICTLLQDTFENHPANWRSTCFK
jgi:hypothetical protein